MNKHDNDTSATDYNTLKSSNTLKSNTLKIITGYNNPDTSISPYSSAQFKETIKQYQQIGCKSNDQNTSVSYGEKFEEMAKQLYRRQTEYNTEITEEITE
jgi:hypothetical protein